MSNIPTHAAGLQAICTTQESHLVGPGYPGRKRVQGGSAWVGAEGMWERGMGSELPGKEPLQEPWEKNQS